MGCRLRASRHLAGAYNGNQASPDISHYCRVIERI